MKKYWFSVCILFLLTIIVVLNINWTRHTDVNKDVQVPVEEYEAGGQKGSSSPSTYEIDLPRTSKGVASQILHRKGYVVSYNKDYLIPNWVAWHLTEEHLYGDTKRSSNAWHEDTDVPTPRATSKDYKGSGWTRGHMCPAGDNKWDGEAMYETFMFTNCCPQDGKLNSGTWNQIELACRRWAEKYGDVYIVCGPVFLNQKHKVIGENRVVVPEAFFKVVVCLKKGHEKGIGFICRNNDGNKQMDLYVNSIKQVERITGITFFPHLTQEIADKVKNDAKLNEWK